MADKDNCTICLEDIGEDDCVKTKCGHSFHFSCLYKNIKKNKRSGDKCPLCRLKYIEANLPKPPKPPYMTRVFSNRRNFYSGRFRSIDVQSNRVNIALNRVNVPINTRVPNILNNESLYPLPRVTTGSIKRYIDALSFSELKNELKNNNLSTRGYRRITLEKRLKRHLVIVNFTR